MTCSLRSRLSASVSRVASRSRSQAPTGLRARRARRASRPRGEPVVERDGQRLERVAGRAPADRLRELVDRSRIGARQLRDRSVDQGADASPSGSRRRRASRTEPSARAAAAARDHARPRRPRARRGRRRPRRSRGREPLQQQARQRERRVARTWPGRCATIRISERGGGSSIIFSRRWRRCG